MIGILTLGAIALGLAAAKRNENGIGRVKRRIYRELSIAQGKGVDFTGKYFDLTSAQMEAVKQTGEQFGWKQTKRSVESGKSYGEAYYNSLKRAYNAISGVAGIGDTRYNVRNADGKIILTWHDLEPAVEHLTAEPEAAPIVEEAPDFELKPVLTKQQEILEVWPYLRTYDAPEDMYEVDERGMSRIPITQDFNYVVWRTMKGPDGEIDAEGPIMAFYSQDKAEEYKKQLPHGKQTSTYSNGSVISFGSNSYSVKHVSKINMKKFEGLHGITYFNSTLAAENDGYGEDEMQEVMLKDVKDGFFKLKPTDSAPVWQKIEYDRSERKYLCEKYDGSGWRYFPGNKIVYAGFYF